MKISIITPHYNDLEGIKQIFECLSHQNSELWEWIIVDDFSEIDVKNSLQNYIVKLDEDKIRLIFNDNKTNASVCRNMGIDYSSYATLVFLDSDDVISEDFVKNRLIEVEEFVVYKNYNIVNEKNENRLAHNVSGDFLNHFLSAKFVWQTTAILWNKSFLISIGKFNPNLQRLQDVELSIRALFIGKKYQIIDNKVDFFYKVYPIRTRKNFVEKVTTSVNYLISEIYNNYKLNAQQKTTIKGYYYLCVKYLHRFKNKDNIKHVSNSLKLFYTKKYISFNGYLIGLLLLKGYSFRLISDDLFLKLNRYFYKE